jgi:hypothetical protein
MLKNFRGSFESRLKLFCKINSNAVLEAAAGIFCGAKDATMQNGRSYKVEFRC